jgi:aldehyde:ferredoxin oxidoreductase
MEPVDSGPAAGKIPVGLDDAIKDYYKERGWDKNGKPTMQKLKSLGLERFAR